ncbi:MAG: MarR family transcriptional regulator [Dehalococcoidales bacterium]|nr:MAG: MarR family transcriptional regulator [Dehalococcoidales bacterium]
MNIFLEDDLYFRVIQLIDSISAYNRRHVERHLKPLNMTYPQMAALMLLHRTDGVSQRELADLNETDTTNMMVICDSLEKRGWINRVTGENDRRVKRICLTEKGKKAYTEGQEILWKGINYMREKTVKEELKGVLPFLEDLNRNTKSLYEGKIN